MTAASSHRTPFLLPTGYRRVVSGVVNPRGPLPPSVYWVRRGLALLAVILVLLVLRFVWSHTLGSNGSGQAGPTPVPSTSSASPSHTPTKTPSPTASPTKASPTPTPSPSASTLRTCTDGDITVTASTDAASYVVGSTPKLHMRIQNTSSTPCRRDVGSAANDLVITSGTAHVWASDDCNPGGPSSVVAMQPDQSYSVTVTWLGRLSAKGCPANEPFAQPGSYSLVGHNVGAVSAPAVFALTQG